MRVLPSNIVFNLTNLDVRVLAGTATAQPETQVETLLAIQEFV